MPEHRNCGFRSSGRWSGFRYLAKVAYEWISIFRQTPYNLPTLRYQVTDFIDSTRSRSAAEVQCMQYHGNRKKEKIIYKIHNNTA